MAEASEQREGQQVKGGNKGVGGEVQIRHDRALQAMVSNSAFPLREEKKPLVKCV